MPTESRYPKVDIPNADIWAFLFERTDRPFPDDKDAHTSRSYTYNQVKDTAINFGKGLKSVWEWQKEDVLALFTPNCIDTPAIIWGTHWAGGIISPANPGYTADELAFQLKDSGAKALVTQKPFLKIALEAAKQADIPEDRIILMGDERDETYKFKHFSAVRNLAGLTCLIHQSLYSGLTLVVMPKFEIEKFCSIIQEHKITFAYVVPPVVLLLGKHPIIDRYDLSSLRMLNSGAAPLTQELVEAVFKRLKVPIKQGYGLSETSPTTHTQPWEEWDKTIGSVGKLLPNQTAKYMSPEEKELPIGETGELWIKGPNVFKGYHNNLEGTKNALTDDGYFKTGDVGHQDKDGNFYITDRVKELIKYKGFQVPPAELEGLLISHPKVDDVAVVGVYNKDQATEVPRAYITPKSGVEGSPEIAKEIISWLQAKVANHKRLRGGVRFVDEVPKSASGKILRRLLKIKAQEEEDKGARAKL
ncbi:hypothetical protein P7C71_g1152, partial [Lecanoromycetidae sp. Uapishka_2]